MKTNALARIYALAMSILFATVATVGVAVLMTSSGEHSRMECNVRAVLQQPSQAATTELSQWHGPAINTRQVL